MTEPSLLQTLRTVSFSHGSLVLFNQWRDPAPHTDFLVTTTMRSGTKFYSLGFQFSVNNEFPSCVLLTSDTHEDRRSFAVGDDDIAHVGFEPMPKPAEGEPSLFGFAAHALRKS